MSIFWMYDNHGDNERKKIIPQLQSHGYRDESETPWQPFVAMEKCLFPKRNGWEKKLLIIILVVVSMEIMTSH